MKAKSRQKSARAPENSGSEEQGVPVAQTNASLVENDIIALHRARFIDWAPAAVTALSASSDGTVLAAARESGNIELWHTDHWSLALVCHDITKKQLIHC